MNIAENLPGLNTDASLALNDTGERVVVWKNSSSNSSKNNIYVSTKSSGDTWSNPKKLSTGQFNNQSSNPKVAMNSAGYIVVVFEANNGIVALTKSKGQDWSSPEKVVETGDSPEVALSGANYIVIAYSNAFLYSITKTANQSWSAPALISNKNSSSLQLVMSNSGFAALGWQHSPEIGTKNAYLSTKTMNGEWSSEEVVVEEIEYFKIDINNNNQMILSWTKLLEEPPSLYAATKSGTESISSPTLVHEGGGLSASYLKSALINDLGLMGILTTDGLFSTNNNNSWSQAESVGRFEQGGDNAFMSLNNVGQFIFVFIPILARIPVPPYRVFSSIKNNSFISKEFIISGDFPKSSYSITKPSINNSGLSLSAFWYEYIEEVQNAPPVYGLYIVESNTSVNKIFELYQTYSRLKIL